MKAKLIKNTVGEYQLIVDKVISNSIDFFKLSIINCQAIEQDSPLQEYVLEVNGEGWDDHLYRGSRKQTEWDVEVRKEYVGECKGNNNDGCFLDSPGHDCGCYEYKPKLDADGCLILKTFKSE